MKRRVFLTLILGASAVGWGQDLPGWKDSPNGIPFEMNRDFGVILVRVQVNGQQAMLIVDTGCSHSVLSSELLRVRSLALEPANPATKGSGYVANAGWGRATLQIGTITWQDRRVLVTDDFQDLSKSLKQRVDGIIGEDILKEFALVVLDFKHHRLVLLQ